MSWVFCIPDPHMHNSSAMHCTCQVYHVGQEQFILQMQGTRCVWSLSDWRPVPSSCWLWAVGFPTFQSELLLTLLAGHPELWQITKTKPNQDKNKTKKAQQCVKQQSIKSIGSSRAGRHVPLLPTPFYQAGAIEIKTVT